MKILWSSDSPSALHVQTDVDFDVLGKFTRKDRFLWNSHGMVVSILANELVSYVIAVPGHELYVYLNRSVRRIPVEEINKLVTSIGHYFMPNSNVEIDGLSELPARQTSKE